VLAFRLAFILRIELKETSHGIIFAQDDLGNFYAQDSLTGFVHFISRATRFEAIMASDLYSFIKELEKRQFKLNDWTDELLN